MIAMKSFSFKALLASALMAFAVTSAGAAEISGVKYDDAMKVSGKELKLNGLGVRTKFVLKVYAAGLYLQEKQSTVEGVLKVEGPRRMRLVMMRDVTSDSFGEAFMAGLNDNVSTAEKSKIISQISKFGEMFALLPGLKSGDVLDLDWLPGVGMQNFLNGKPIGEVTQDLAFYNAVLKIWLGEKPVDRSLKPKLLAPAPAPAVEKK